MALSKIIPDSLTDNARGMGGKFLHKITISNDATVAFSSTYITDAYDYYDVIISDLVPETDAKFLRCRFGVGGTVYSGSTDYNYGVWHFGHNQSDNQEFNSGVDAGSSAMLITTFQGLGELGTGTGEQFNAHYRFYNLRSTTFYKGVTNMDTFGRVANDFFMTIRKGLMLGTSNINRTNKIDTMQFSMETGNIVSGSMSLYGWKK